MGEEYNGDFESMLKRCRDARIEEIMIITLKLEETRRALAFAAADPKRFKVAMGIFPEDVCDMTEEYWQQFCKLAEDPGVSVIGEIGLDYYWVKDENSKTVSTEKVSFAPFFFINFGIGVRF